MKKKREKKIEKKNCLSDGFFNGLPVGIFDGIFG